MACRKDISSSSHCLHISREQFLTSALFLIISAIFVYFFSYSTSPWAAYFYGGDSAQFQTIGKAWALGKIPYGDMFDHKGPLIFFIDMLGYSLTGSSSGIMIIQVLFLSVTLWFVYSISQLVTDRISYGIITLSVFLILLTFIYGDGNYTEEYCLPFITMSMYFQVKYFYSKSKESAVFKTHNPLLALVYGLSFGVCVMTKITNGISICAGVIVISVILIASRQWKNLLENAVFFILGMALIIAPFSIYFMQKGIFSEFIYATISYNFEYQQDMHSWLNGATAADLFNFLIRGFTYYTIFITAILAWFGKKKSLAIYCVITGCLETYLYLSGALYSQYYMIALPQIVLLLNEIYMMKEGTFSGKLMKTTLSLMITLLCLCRVIYVLPAPLNYHNYYRERSEIYEPLLNEIPDEERASFIAWGGNELKELYLLYDLMPCYRYFIIQPWHASFSESVKNDIYNTFRDGEAQWILANSESTAIIKDVLEKDYREVDSVDKYILYNKLD